MATTYHKVFVFVGKNPTNKSGRSSKIWAVKRSGTSVFIMYGKIAGNVIVYTQTKELNFSSTAEAKTTELVRINQKLMKGYKPKKNKKAVINTEEIDYTSVKSSDAIRKQIDVFNRGLQSNVVAQFWTGRRLSSSRYWVQDSGTGKFGLSKFVGYSPLSMKNYMLRDVTGQIINGGTSWKKIETVTGKKFGPSVKTLKDFKKWVADVLLDEAEDSLKYSKLKFITI